MIPQAKASNGRSNYARETETREEKQEGLCPPWVRCKQSIKNQQKL